jgi:hypothetical protein
MERGNKMTEAVKVPDLSKITKAQLLHLLDEAQQTTLLLLSWAGSFDLKAMKSKSSSIDLSPYYLKWIDIAKMALANLSEPIDDTVKKTLIDDMATIAIVPIKGMQMAIQTYAKQLNVVLPESKASRIDDITEFKKVALAELEEAMVLLKDKQDKQEGQP